MTTPAEQMRREQRAASGGLTPAWQPPDAAVTSMTTPIDSSAVQFTQTGTTAGVRLPRQLGLSVLRVNFAAAGGNSGPLLLQRGLGAVGEVAPPFANAGDNLVISVPAGQQFTAQGDPAERWWVKTASNSDQVVVTCWRTS